MDSRHALSGGIPFGLKNVNTEERRGRDAPHSLFVLI